jgi:phosphohistidine phosphatase
MIKSSEGLIEQSGIGPDDPISPIIRRLKDVHGSLMIVGHLPHLDKLASKLLTGKTSREVVKLFPGSIAALAVENGKWSLQWVISPEVALALAPHTPSS